jgi:hypothetical protein
MPIAKKRGKISLGRFSKLAKPISLACLHEQLETGLNRFWKAEPVSTLI